MIKYTKIITIIILISLNNSLANKSKTKQPQTQLSFCEKLDSIINQLNVNFKNITGRLYDQENDSVAHYLSTFNIDNSACEVIFKHHKYYYQGFFTSMQKNDSAWAAKKYDSLKISFRDCLQEWSHQDIIDSRRNFPFTRFIKDSTQLELYYLKNSYDDSTYSVGVVVESW